MQFRGMATKPQSLATDAVPLKPLKMLDCYKTTAATGKIYPYKNTDKDPPIILYIYFIVVIVVIVANTQKSLISQRFQLATIF